MDETNKLQSHMLKRNFSSCDDGLPAPHHELIYLFLLTTKVTESQNIDPINAELNSNINKVRKISIHKRELSAHAAKKIPSDG